jgi:hypothetical protein
LEVPSDAVYRKGIQVMKMKISALMSVADIFWIHFVQPICFSYFGTYVVLKALKGVGHIAIFTHLPVQFVNVVFDKGRESIRTAFLWHKRALGVLGRHKKPFIILRDEFLDCKAAL